MIVDTSKMAVGTVWGRGDVDISHHGVRSLPPPTNTPAVGIESLSFPLIKTSYVCASDMYMKLRLDLR